MKKILFMCSTCIWLSFSANEAGAANQWWDNNGTGTPTSGVWDTTTPNWTGSVSSNLTVSTVPFTNGNFAEFAAGSGSISALTITVPGAVTCAGLATGLNAATVTNTTFSGAGSINLTTNGGATVTGGGSALFQGIFCGPSGSDSLIFNVPITGSAGLEQHSSGSLQLDATNTYSGGTDLTGGQLIFYNNNSSFGTGPIIVNGNGNALVSGSTNQITLANNIIFPQAEAVNLAGNNVGTTPGTIFTGTVTLPSTGIANLETSSTASTIVEITGVISGAGVLETSDDGTLQLAGVNTYTGNTAIASPATLAIVGTGQLGSGSYSGTITNGNVFVYKSSATQTLSGVISGTGKLTNNGTGKLILAAINTYTNTTTVNGGSGCVLQLGDGVSKSGTVGGAIAVTNPASLVLAPGGSAVTYNGGSQVISGTGAVTMNGPGTFIIGGNHNTYTGGTIINGGILQTGGDSTSGGAAANLGASPASFQAANITLGGGTLQGNNANFAFVPNRGITLAANSGLSAIISGNGPIPDQGELGIQGPITDNNAGFGITITGQTNLTTGLLSGVYLEGNNTYTGPTVVASGVLSLFANGSINSSSSLSIASGAAFDVSSNTATTWNLNQPLTANGSGLGLPGFFTVAPTPAAIFVGANGGMINLGAQLLNLTITPTNFAGDGNQPALYVSQGTVALNGNSVYVTNNAATPLGYGSYTLIQQASGSMSVLSAPTLAGGLVYGNGIAAGATASLAVSGGALTLVVAPNGVTNPNDPYFSSLTPAPSFTYGSASSVMLSGTVSNQSGGIATAGDTITVQVGSLGAQPATIGANGSFSITYTLPAFTAAGYYPVTYSYSGTLGSASDSSTSLQISQALLSVTASDPSRNYNGGTSASVTLTPAPLNGDSVTVSGSASPFGTTNFASANVGSGITVTITGLKLTGAAAGNYYLPSTYTLSGNINTPSFTWDGLDSVTNANFQWGDQFNWTGNVAPDLIGDSLDFGGTTGLVPVVQAAYTNWSVTFDSTAGSFVVTNLGTTTAAGFAIGAGGITNNSTNPQTIAVPVNALTSSSSLWYVTNGGSLLMSSNVSDVGGGITLAGAGTLSLAGSNNAVTGPFTNVTGTLAITGGAKVGNGTYAGAINNSGTFLFNSTSNQTLSGVISGSGTLIDAGTGTLTLSGANTYTGQTIVSNSSLVISKDSNLGTPPSSPVANQLVLNNFINGGANNYGLRDTGGTFTLNANRGIFLGPLGGSINVQNGVTLTVAGTISGPGSFYASPNDSAGFGTIILTANNTYTGGTFIGAGVLELGVNGALPTGTPLTINQAASTVAATFRMNGLSQTVGPLQSAQFGGAGVLLPTIDLSGALTVLETNATTTFSGVMTNSGGSLTIAVPNGGIPGTLVLSGTNTYSGATVINAGTLALSTKGSISNSASISIAAGATLDVSALTSTTYNLSASTSVSAAGTGTVIGSTAASINGASAGTVSLGAQPISLTYTPSSSSGDSTHPALYVAQGTLQLNNNAITINNASVQPLGAGTYTIIQQAVGSVSGTPNSVVTLTGSGLAAGTTASVSVSGGSVNLVVVSAIPPTPVINSFSIVSGQLVLSGTNGSDNGTFIVLTSTNAALPLNQWTPLSTNTFSGSGAFNVTNNISGNQMFFRIQIPY